MKILVLGKNGMLGQTVYKYLTLNSYDVDGTTTNDFNVLDDQLEDKYNLSNYDYVINCIGLLNHESDVKKLIFINALFPHRLDDLSTKYSFKLIHISTDCYLDNTIYGHSKWLGELRDSNNITLRTSIIGYDKYKSGTGLFNWFIKEKKVTGYINHIWYGVTALELAKVIEKCFKLSIKGIVEVSNGEGISKYKLLCLINKIYSLNIKIIPKITKKSTKKVLKSSNYFKIPSYKTMVQEMRRFDEC